jgi:threonine/homoserine/homoserine lactone efflux protein
MGNQTLLLYLLGISLSSILLGLATNALIASLGISVEVDPAAAVSEASRWFEYLCGLILLVFSLLSLKRSFLVKVEARHSNS